MASRRREGTLANRLRLWNRRKRSNLIKKFLAGEDSLRGTVTTTVRKAGDGLQFASPLTIHVHGQNYDYGAFEIPVTDKVHGPLVPEDEGTGLHLESAFSHFSLGLGFEIGCPFGARHDWSKEHLEYGQICLPISIERFDTAEAGVHHSSRPDVSRRPETADG